MRVLIAWLMLLTPTIALPQQSIFNPLHDNVFILTDGVADTTIRDCSGRRGGVMAKRRHAHIGDIMSEMAAREMQAKQRQQEADRKRLALYPSIVQMLREYAVYSISPCGRAVDLLATADAIEADAQK